MPGIVPPLLALALLAFLSTIPARALAYAQEQVKQARAAMEEDKRQAMAKLQSEAARLATDIVRAVMRPMASPSQAGGQ